MLSLAMGFMLDGLLRFSVIVLKFIIKGAIGSHFKIDASYLSPNVNIASRLEAATKQYGC
jgi:hypothetical protein